MVPTPGRAPRADAQRNRTRVLEVAMEAFASDGLAVPLHEIARRAGLGTGTVSRHFPTKEALYEAIVLARIDECVSQARLLSATKARSAPRGTAARPLRLPSTLNRGLGPIREICP